MIVGNAVIGVSFDVAENVHIAGLPVCIAMNKSVGIIASATLEIIEREEQFIVSIKADNFIGKLVVSGKWIA